MKPVDYIADILFPSCPPPQNVSYTLIFSYAAGG